MDRLDGGTAPQLSFDDTEDTAFLAGDEDATGILRVVAGVSLVDIGPLDRTAGESLGAVDDVAQGVTVVGVIWQRPGVQHEQAAGGPAVVGDDGGPHPELVGRSALAALIPKMFRRLSPGHSIGRWRSSIESAFGIDAGPRSSTKFVSAINAAWSGDAAVRPWIYCIHPR